MRHFFFLVVVVVALCMEGAISLSCPKGCNKKMCPQVICSYGVGNDICGCCPKCYGGPGDECGGAWNNRGSCGKGLVCESEPLYKNKPYFSEYPNLPVGRCTYPSE